MTATPRCSTSLATFRTPHRLLIESSRRTSARPAKPNEDRRTILADVARASMIGVFCVSAYCMKRGDVLCQYAIYLMPAGLSILNEGPLCSCGVHLGLRVPFGCPCTPLGEARRGHTIKSGFPECLFDGNTRTPVSVALPERPTFISCTSPKC